MLQPETTLREMTLADLPFAHSLRNVVGWNQTLDDWKRFLELSSTGCFLAGHNGTRAGTAITMCYGQELAWIGMVLVHPDFRGRGLGRSLLNRCLEYLRERGIRCIKLDATPQGKLLYDRLGFQDEWPLTRWENRDLRLAGEATGEDIRPHVLSDAHAIEQLDRRAFGVSRAALVNSLLRQCRLALVHESENGLAGYGVLRQGSRAAYLGPVVAPSPHAGEVLVRSLLAGANGNPVFWDIPDANADAVALARKFDFTPQRHLLRMFLGENQHPGEPGHCFAIIDPAVG